MLLDHEYSSLCSSSKYYGATGAGRVDQQITEHLAQESQVQLHILAEPAARRQIVYKVAIPWTNYCTAESYAPTRQARLVGTLHDAAFFEKTAS